ncbi:MAG: ISL3 family transposase [Puniceicoccaceae bacterium]
MCNIGIPGYVEIDGGSKLRPNQIKVGPEREPTQCRCCGSEHIRSKGWVERTVRHLPRFGMDMELVVRHRRFRCQGCGKSFGPHLPGIRPWHRFSEPYREELYKLHEDGVCASRLAWRQRIGAATVGRVYAEYTARKARERRRLQCPQVLGIDEHTLHRNGKYVTTFCDLKNHKVFDVAEGRSASELAHYLSGLRGRHKVRVICIDMSNPYRAMIKKWFRNAILVSDRFHAVRLVMHHIVNQARELHEELKYKRGWLTALRKNPGRLTERQKQTLDELFGRFPILKVLYEKMREICDLLNKKGQSKRSCRQHARDLFRHIQELKDSPFEHLHKLAKALHSWAEPIGAMWRFSRSNSITEGFHRKMKLIQRRAYGFRNFNNYRLRVIAQCG